jgi:hypothetical protein
MKTTIKKSEVALARTKAEHTRELVLALLDWSEEKYGNFVFDMATFYLKRQCGADEFGVKMLLESKIFWSWWKNHWAQRDSNFLAIWADCNCLIDVVNEYEFLHNQANLHISPNKTVLELSFSMMIKGFIKEGVTA